DGTALPKDPEIEVHGCGFTHPVSKDGGADQQIDRRVEIFLFEGKVDPKPKTPCPTKGCGEYPKWVEQTVLTVDLDQPPGALVVTVTGEDKKPIDGVAIHASGPLILDAKTGADGIARDELSEIVPGSYKVIA